MCKFTRIRAQHRKTSSIRNSYVHPLRLGQNVPSGTATRISGMLRDERLQPKDGNIKEHDTDGTCMDNGIGC